MFLVPLFIVVSLGFAVSVLVRHRHAMVSGHGSAVAVEHRPFSPTTRYGWVGLGAAVLTLVTAALVNVVQVRYLAWACLLSSLVFTGLARFAKHDRSVSVSITFIVTAIGATAALLFLAGEVVIGHD